MFKVRSVLTAAIIITVFCGLLANQVPRETVIAEYDGGKISFGDIEDRISKIPPMYQTKYKTEDGMKSLLDIICTEEVFYLEALDSEIQNSEKYIEHTEMQVSLLLFNEYKKDILAKNIEISEEEKQNYFREHSQDFYAGRVYDEVFTDVENKLRTEAEQIYFAEHYSNLRKEYEIVINTDLLSQIDLEDLDNNSAVQQEKLFTSSHPQIERTVNYLLIIFPELPPQQKKLLIEPDNLQEYVEEIARTRAYANEALESGYEEREDLKEIISQIEKNVMLRNIYNILVVDAVNITDNDLQDYYNSNIQEYSSKATRKIQVFTFETEEKAKKILKKVKKAIKKDKADEIKNLITENCLYTMNDGFIGNIYNNGIIPGFGKDETLAELIWAEPALKLTTELTEIFQNNKSEFMFFRLIEDNVAEAKPYEEVKEKIRTKMNKDLTRSTFEETTSTLKDKYNVVTYDDRMFVVLTAEEYFNLAEEGQKKRRYEDAIYYYDKVIQNHKNQVDDYKALFMKAFIYAEEINNHEMAIELFNQLIDEYPVGDLHESAQFMILELEGKSNIIDSFESDE